MGKRRKLNTIRNSGQSQDKGHSIDSSNELSQNNNSMTEEGSSK